MIRKTKRMDRVDSAFTRMPLRPHVVDESFALFCETGELPVEQRVADAVCRRALGGTYLNPPVYPTTRNLAALIQITVCGPSEPAPKPPPSVRECVFREAVFETGFVQKAARVAILTAVDEGGDVTSEQFLADKVLPEYGTVGFQLIGFPEHLAKPPYQAQAKRLLVRMVELRRRIDSYADDPWFDTLTDALLQFEDTGVLPADELLRDTVLVDAEMLALWDHRRGKDVRDLMVVFDEAAQAKGAKREAAIERVQATVRERARARRQRIADCDSGTDSVQNSAR